MKIIWIAAAGLFLSPGYARAEVIAVCSGPVGRAYYVSPSDGWVDDAITGGTATILWVRNEFNIIIKDASGSTFDMKSDGATIVANGLDGKLGTLTLTAIYKDTPVVEVFQLTRRPGGKMKLLWSSNKNGLLKGAITKSSLFTADCD